MSTSPPSDTALDLLGEIEATVNGAFDDGHPLVLGYIGEDGYPHLSYRGTAQVYGPQQLAIWARNPEGGFQRSIASRPEVSLLYFKHGTPPGYYSFKGKARVEESANETVYENSPKAERDRDPDKGGVAVIVEVDSLEGYGANGFYRTEREGS
jgi:hypothetical protein